MFIENKTNSENERFVATLIYNIASQQFPQPYKYTEFWEHGVEEPSEIISYIAARIDKTKYSLISLVLILRKFLEVQILLLFLNLSDCYNIWQIQV